MASPYYFDKSIARAAVDFFSRHCRFTEGEWAGKPFELRPHQEKRVSNIYGWRRRSDGTRRYRRVRVWEPKKNGKTEEMAGHGHILTIGDGEPGAAVYSHARDKNQASIVFNKARRMVEMDYSRRGAQAIAGPLALAYEGSTKTSLWCSSLLSSFQPLSGDPTGKHGPSVHAALGDEAHEWRDGTMHSFLVKGMIARRQPLDMVYSTAGIVNTYGHELYLDSKAILENPDLDPECYVEIYEASAEDDWESPEIQARANPNFGVSVKPDFMAGLVREAKRRPSFVNDFLRYHLNIWVEQSQRWFQMHKWRENTARPDDPRFWLALRELMRGRRGTCGIDLASNDDIVAVVFWFEPEKPGDRYVIVPFFFVPEETIDIRDKPATPYRQWVKDGALIATPGERTDFDFVVKHVLECAGPYGLKREIARKGNAQEFSIAIDSWNAVQFSTQVQKADLPISLFNQNFSAMNEPSQRLESLFHAGKLEHGNHPVLRWMFGNAAIRSDDQMRIRPTKKYAAEKIDGVVAAVMANALAMVGEIDNRSVYETRGLRMV